MATTEAIGEGLTFEKVWAAIQATDAQIKATDAQIKATGEQIKAHDEQIKADKEWARDLIKASDKKMGELTNRFGEMVEHMVLPNLLTKFDELGFTFTKAGPTTIEDKVNGIFTDVDAVLENGDKVMIVETKTKPKIEDIDDHIERMEKMRRHADLHNDQRVYLGAMAGVVFGKSEKTYALKKGFYVLEPAGDTFAITVPEGCYYPHEW
ncbi:conserved hypothetical protein [Treponema primitia ZAS-2]|uniref:DUF3782 domain-containing protein n=1 Tax=Treponema primitia (strain ATCC BAA-887 / DSM 12427 / ZAS-2) TaxID=545694 RepID=F5YGX0_TREPZ|nr:hypothetical protein [Treponema primitia]AEF84179.1 conserved hypothetical protein [Treponema primitia ZAS-2]